MIFYGFRLTTRPASQSLIETDRTISQTIFLYEINVSQIFDETEIFVVINGSSSRGRGGAIVVLVARGAAIYRVGKGWGEKKTCILVLKSLVGIVYTDIISYISKKLLFEERKL